KKGPVWAVNFLQNLARYVFRTGNVFGVHHHLDLNGPIALGEATDIQAALFVADPELPAINTPNGRVQFLQVVGLTRDEMHALEEWQPAPVVELLARDNPLLITDLKRKSILRDPETARAIEEGALRDGSSANGIYVNPPSWKETKRQE